MRPLLTLMLLSLSQCILETLFISSANTPKSLISKLQDTSRIIEFSSQDFPLAILELKTHDFSLLIDITLNCEYISLIDQISVYFQVAYLTISDSDFPTSFPNRFFVHEITEKAAESVKSVIEFLDLKDFTIMYSSNYIDIKMSSILRSAFKNQITSSISYDENIDFSNADLLIRRMIKAKGVRNLIIIDSSDSLEIIQKTIQERNLVKEGSIFLFYTKSPRKVIIDGALVSTEAGGENSESRDQNDIDLIKKAIDNIATGLNKSCNLYDKNSIYEYLKREYPNKHISNPYKILNIQQGQQIEIGVYIKTLNITDKIIFPGNLDYIITNESLTPITISIANGTSELINNASFPIFSYWYLGAQYAVWRSNQKKDLKNFYLELFPTDCGNLFYDLNLSIKCFSPILENLGIAYLTSIWGTVAYGNAVTLTSLNEFIPQISPFATNDEIENTKEFPEFFNLSPTSIELFSTGFILMRAFGWNAANIFILDSDSNYKFYEAFISFANNTGFSIVNNPETRFIPANYTRKDFFKYKKHFENAKNTRCRIFLIIANNVNHIIEGLYDVGIRKGDAVFISGDFQFINYFVTEEDEKYLKKTLDLIEDSFVFSIKEWNGELGEQLYEEMSMLFPDVSMMCLTYDTVSLVKEALDYIFLTGNDYEDPYVLASTLRNLRIDGCIGSIYFSRDSNCRQNTVYSFYQVRKNDRDGSLYYQELAKIDKYSSQSIIFITSVHWPNGDITYPSNFRQPSECGYDKYLLTPSHKGRLVLLAISILLLIMSIIPSYFSWKKFQSQFSELLTTKQLSDSDALAISYIFIWLNQIISLCPQTKLHSTTLKNFHLFLALDFLNYFTIKNDKYWYITYFLISFCYFWSIICILISKEVHILYEKNYFIKKLTHMTKHLIPFVANTCFIPIISTLIEIFMCIEGIGNDLTQSFLERDCYSFCYTSSHKFFMIFICASLLFYIWFAVYYKPLWEITQSNLNIRTKALFQGIFSVFQVSLVVIQKVLKDYNEIVAGSLDCAVLAFIVIMSLYIKPFNYMRINVVFYTMLVLAFWNLIISIVFSFDDGIYMKVVWIVGFFIVFAIGVLVYNRFPKMLVSKHDKRVTTLFQFQFGRVRSRTKYAVSSNCADSEMAEFND